MEPSEYKIIFPNVKENMDQNEEWFIVDYNGQQRKIRSHDYDEIYKIPGLYEDFFYNRLGCRSPNVVCGMLEQEMKKADESELRVFDFGAGNGIVGEVLREMDCDLLLLVGVDILSEAKDALERDRPGIYDDYYVMDMSCLSEAEEKKFKAYNFNTLITVAALGFDDIPTAAFLNVFNMLDGEAWVAFNIKDRFLSEKDESGYKDVIEEMMNGSLSILQEKKYCHRRSITGEELCYHAIVGKKTDDVSVST